MSRFTNIAVISLTAFAFTVLMGLAVASMSHAGPQRINSGQDASPSTTIKPMNPKPRKHTIYMNAINNLKA
ncbi:MAG: hypothetical protein ACR2PA_13365 [Hyphomicrobiaceae bacterium]